MNEAVRGAREIAEEYAGEAEEARDYLLRALKEDDPDLGAAVAAILAGEQTEYLREEIVVPAPAKVYRRESSRQAAIPAVEPEMTEAVPGAAQSSPAEGGEWAEYREAFREAGEPPKPAEPEPEPPKSGMPAVVQRALAGGNADALEEMNRHHMAILNIAGKFRVASWVPSKVDPQRKVISYQTVEDFRNGYMNDFVKVQTGTDENGNAKYDGREKGAWWLRNSRRRTYRGVVFEPNEPERVRDCLNLWQGWGVEAKPGDWSLIREHIEKVIAGGNAALGEYYLKWFAWAIQNPGKPAEVALVPIGRKGTGKGTLRKVCKRIFGPHAMQVNDVNRIIGRFNHQLEDLILLIADEMAWTGRAKGQLQGLITEDTIIVEPKNIGMYEARNNLHIIMPAEPGWVIPAGADERRYAAGEVSEHRMGDFEYFKALHAEIDGDGPAAMLWDLRQMRLGDWHPRQLPGEVKNSVALLEQQSRSLPPLEAWWWSVLDAGRLPGGFEKRPFIAWSSKLLEGAQASSGELKQRLNPVRLATFIKGDLVGAKQDRQSRASAWEFPPLAQCRAAFERRYGKQGWSSEDDWLWWQDVEVGSM